MDEPLFAPSAGIPGFLVRPTIAMKRMSNLIFLTSGLMALVLGVPSRADAAEIETTPIDARVDALFEPWNHADGPGLACAVMQDGAVVYAKGFGMADLEHDEAISPDSVFYIASTSKQFTAAAIALLVLDGRVSLDAGIRTYLPEFQSFGDKVTVDHLIHHTSGIRDYFSLLSLTGWRDTDYFNNDMVVKFLARQRDLNFEPGTEFLYSNSNYVLLAEIVKRVTGVPLRDFAAERIFAPLGMTHTSFDDDYRRIVKHRVISYQPGPDGGYQQLLKEFDGHGDGNLLTTVRDLARWEENFHTGTVGGQAFIDLMLTRGVLKNGTTLDYAFGLMVGRYRGLPTVRHAGGFKGFRTDLLRFPEQHFSVAVLANFASIDPSGLANQVADLFLEGKLEGTAQPATPAAIVTPEAKVIDPSIFDAYVGDYALEEHPTFILSFTREGDRFFSQASDQPKVEIFASSETTFFLKVVDAQVTFHREADGSVERMTLHQHGDHPARRVVPYAMTEEALREYAGTYRSEELNTAYRLEVAAGKLKVTHDRLPDVTVEPSAPDAFRGSMQLDFMRDDQGKISGFRLSGPRVRNLVFERSAADR